MLITDDRTQSKEEQLDMKAMGRLAKQAAFTLAITSTAQKNKALAEMANQLEWQSEAILKANKQDLAAAAQAGLSDAIMDRLMLNSERLKAIADDVRNVIKLADPIGSELDCRLLENGMKLSRRRVPLGVVGVIYEARPNVTIDIAALCLKTGNASILRGGKETFLTNMALVNVIQRALEVSDLPSASVQYIENPDRVYVNELLALDDYVDMIIPRGGESLHKMCKANSSIPVIIGGFGISHMYVDASADIEASVKLIANAKLDKPSACNALDTLLVHKDIAPMLLPPLLAQIGSKVRLVAETNAMTLLSGLNLPKDTDIRLAQAGDFDTEWLDYVLGIKCVDSIDQAIEHMVEHNASHSDAILTNDLKQAERFINSIDSAAIYVNASTRFTDGAQFGLGAEVAVSTQKLHARGPMGLEALTSYKWVGVGDYLCRGHH